jgi:hypothetical protein
MTYHHDVPTRTTLTLDDDVAAGLDREVRRSGRPLRAIVNEALRVGLERRRDLQAPPFRIQPITLGLRDGLGIDDIEGLLDQVEGPERR